MWLTQQNKSSPIAVVFQLFNFNNFTPDEWIYMSTQEPANRYRLRVNGYGITDLDKMRTGTLTAWI